MCHKRRCDLAFSNCICRNSDRNRLSDQSQLHSNAVSSLPSVPFRGRESSGSDSDRNQPGDVLGATADRIRAGPACSRGRRIVTSSRPLKAWELEIGPSSQEERRQPTLLSSRPKRDLQLPVGSLSPNQIGFHQSVFRGRCPVVSDPEFPTGASPVQAASESSRECQ